MTALGWPKPKLKFELDEELAERMCEALDKYKDTFFVVELLAKEGVQVNVFFYYHLLDFNSTFCSKLDFCYIFLLSDI